MKLYSFMIFIKSFFISNILQFIFLSSLNLILILEFNWIWVLFNSDEYNPRSYCNSTLFPWIVNVISSILNQLICERALNSSIIDIIKCIISIRKSNEIWSNFFIYIVNSLSFLSIWFPVDSISYLVINSLKMQNLIS